MKHDIIEKNIGLMIVLILVAISFGGLAQIVPLFFSKSVTEPIDGLKPYTALQLEGRDIYIREGCHVCHTQMVRPLRAETERYGHYSVGGEGVYERPFLWGSKRTGPDLARVGGRYSDEWHRAHMVDPRSVVPESIMPGYPFLARQELRFADIAQHLQANATLGVPYDAAMIAAAKADVRIQASVDADGVEDFQARYPKAQARDFDGDPDRLTELDALIAYLQMLGTLVDFRVYQPTAGHNAR